MKFKSLKRLEVYRMIFVNSLFVEHYKGLHDVSVEGFSPINLITGPNASGKTSLIEALEVLMNPFDFQHYVSVHNNSYERFYGSFDKREPRPYTKISGKILKKNYFTEIVSYQPPSGGNFHGFHHYGYPTSDGEKIQTNEIHYSFFENKLAKQSEPLVRYRKITPKTSSLSFEEITKDSVIQACVLSYLTLFDPNYVEFQKEDFKHTVLYHKIFKAVKEDFFSDGVRHFLKIAEHLSNFHDGIVLLDPADYLMAPNSFPILTELLYHLASKRRLQLFCTTHSLELIDEWLELMCFYHQLSEISIFKIQSKPDSCHITKYSGQTAYELRMEKNEDLRTTR